ncbi:MAG: zinc ABC transporter substrate-binding protein [Syntrophales bacterium]|nr:zinc ABC transporter substrate-binding protein [Syntrophales bacterium]
MIKKIGIVSIIIVLFFLLSPQSAWSQGQKKLSVFVTIAPQAYFVSKICGERCSVHVLIPAHMSPHVYEPTPRQIALLSEAQAYFTIGVAVEDAILPRVKKINKNLFIIPTQAGVEMRKMESAGHHSGPDPHIWLDPQRVKIIAQNIQWALVRLAPDSAERFSHQLKVFLEELDRLDGQIKRLLNPLKGKKIYVFHPAFGYFADAYGLKQVPIEVEGKEPSPRYLARIISEAEKDGIRAIFTQPQFSPKGVQAIAHAVKAQVVFLDPLAFDYTNNLTKIAISIREHLK